jgi:hypothetical protein
VRSYIMDNPVFPELGPREALSVYLTGKSIPGEPPAAPVRAAAPIALSAERARRSAHQPARRPRSAAP